MKATATYYGTDMSVFVDGLGIMNDITQYIVVYDANTQAMQVFFRNNRAIGAVNNATTFDKDNPEFPNVPIRF